jgi:hypothetical protein
MIQSRCYQDVLDTILLPNEIYKDVVSEKGRINDSEWYKNGKIV